MPGVSDCAECRVRPGGVIRVGDDGRCVACGRPMHQVPAVNGVVVDVFILPADFRERVEQAARESNCCIADMVIRLAVQGERCARNHEGRDK